MQTTVKRKFSFCGMARISTVGEDDVMPPRIGHAPKKRRTFIRDWRKFRDLTQEQLAEATGMSTASLSRLETGEQDYTGSTLELLAKALETDVTSLLSRKPSEDEPISQIWAAASPAQRRQIVQISKTITGGGDE
jgi:transcriptional regulator with XRE-family HTH domain